VLAEQKAKKGRNPINFEIIVSENGFSRTLTLSLTSAKYMPPAGVRIFNYNFR